MRKLFHVEAASFTGDRALQSLLFLCRKRCRKENRLPCSIMKTVILILKWEKMNLKVNVLLVLSD